MCEQSYSESGALTYIRGCNEFNLIASDRDRLAGVVAGMEEQVRRNLDALREAEQQNIALQKQIDIFNKERFRIGKENARLREALKAALEHLTNLQPHIQQSCLPNMRPFIDSHVNIAMDAIGNALKEMG